MATHTGTKVIRIQNVPKDTSAEALEELLKQACTDEERSKIGIEVSLVPSCSVRDGSQAAIVKLTPTLPGFLHDLGKTDYQIKSPSSILNVDKNFFGLTQLYPTTGRTTITAEYGLPFHYSL